MEGLNRLEVYQTAMELAKSVYHYVIPHLPSEEKWCLCTQIRRASASIPANIAEGYGRYYYQETIRFCYLARGSLMELMSHIELAQGQDFISDESVVLISEKAERTLKLIHGYINYLKKSKRGYNEPGEKSVSQAAPEYLDISDETPYEAD